MDTCLHEIQVWVGAGGCAPASWLELLPLKFKLKK